MFYCVLISIVLAFAGVTGLWPHLRQYPLIFLGYWAFCGWMTVLAVLLAIYDMAKVRQEARKERDKLRKEYLDLQALSKASKASGDEPSPNAADKQE